MTRQDPIVGRMIDARYLVESRIASGGMASVYLALDRRLDRQVALKVMHDNLATDQVFVTRFVHEARAAARLSHSNVVQVLDQGSDGPVLYLAMEYLPGRTLRDVLTGRGALTPRESVSVLEPVLGALAAAHRSGIVHGDVKPENVILTDDGRIKVADFGLARAITAPITATASGELLGTVGYLAPELVSDGRSDARADVYAAGIMLFELLTGKQPYSGGDPLQIAYRHVHETVPAPSSLAPDLPAAFDDVVLRATSHDPDRRPRDAGVLLSDLHAAMGRVSDAQLDIRAADATALRAEPARTEVFSRPVPVTNQPNQPNQPVAASRPQPTQVLAVSRRSARADGPVLPRLKVHDEQPGVPGFAGDRRRQALAAISATVVVVLLIFVGVWWFTGGPGSELDTPALAGQRQSDAQRALTTLGLANRVTLVYNAKVAAGQVIGTEPVAGAHVKKNGTVGLTVSKGPQLIAVPDVGGMSVAAATAALQKAQLKVGSSTQQASSTVALGQVISTSPKSQTEVAPGGSVNLIVSKGVITILKGVPSNLCIDIPAGVLDNGTRAVLDNCNGGPNQIWTATAQQQLTLNGSTKCLDVAGGSTDDGAAVQLYDCNGTPGQQWTINADGSITALGSGKCLDATDHGTSVATPIQIWDCSGGDNQKWARS